MGHSEEVNCSTYDFEIGFLSTKTNEELGVVVAAESGRWTKSDGTVLSDWNRLTTVWFVSKFSDTWKIVGYYWRDGND